MKMYMSTCKHVIAVTGWDVGVGVQLTGLLHDFEAQTTICKNQILLYLKDAEATPKINQIISMSWENT